MCCLVGQRQLDRCTSVIFLVFGAQASLAELNSRLADALPMNRFRPNFVVNGHDAWDEDTWERLQIGELNFLVNTPNGRCKVST